MWSYRSRGHHPNQFSAELDTREQRDREINERYAMVLAAAEHEDEQNRLRAVKVAGGDVELAKHFLYWQLLFDTEQVR